MDRKTTGIVAYITIIGWLVAYLAGDRQGAGFHLNQALVVGLVSLVGMAVSTIPIIRILGVVFELVWIFSVIFGIVSACNDEEREIPVLGQIKILK